MAKRNLTVSKRTSHPGNAGCLSTLQPEQLAAAYVLMADVGLDAGQAAKAARTICRLQRDAERQEGAAHTWFLVGAHLAQNPQARRYELAGGELLNKEELEAAAAE